MAYYFELPIFTDLTNNQQLALEEDEAVAIIRDDNIILFFRQCRN